MLVTPFVLIAKNLPTNLPPPPCLQEGYYGLSSTGSYAFYVTDIECSYGAADTFTQGHLAPLDMDAQSQLVWFEQVQTASYPNMFPPSSSSDMQSLLNSLDFPEPSSKDGQQVFSNTSTRNTEYLYYDSGSLLVRMDRNLARQVDVQLPPYWKMMILPEAPMPYVSVPSPAVKHVKDLLASVKFDPIVASLVNNISIPQMQKDIRYLTGEDAKSPIISRHSFSDDVLIAADWLKARFEETGAHCQLKQFYDGFAPNVVCSYASTENTTETILLSSHYDSRGSFGSTRAPGGDDDGSGTVGLLSIARTIGRLGIKFKKNVQLVTFAGEEQGLVGSRAYARELREADADLLLMIQADMTGYRKPGEPLQLGLPATIGTPEVAQLISNLSALYSPELTVGITAACCSDHQSFHEQGFPATQVFERAGPIADPMYHNSGDLSDREGYDFDQITAIARVEFAALLHTAGYVLPRHY